MLHKTKGFTLLEIVVSLGILALGVLGIFSLIPAGVDQSRRGQEQGKAVILAQSKMEDIISTAASDWDNFVKSGDHYYFSGNRYEPYYFGPNEKTERINWGWIENAANWVNNMGYQWEWHFIETPSAAESQALISLTVSWPQKWNQTISSAEENTLHDNYKLGTGSSDYFKDNRVQYVRLISYVSKGL